MSGRDVALALGSNLGDRAGQLERALVALTERGVRWTRRSSVYETEPVGGPEQGPYLNLVACGQTDLDPARLLRAALEVEAEAGRVRTVRNAPRTLDVDILFHGGAVLSTPELEIPHPRLHERRFVLVPLAEVAPDWRHPLLGLTARELLARCPDTARVEPWERPVTSP